MDRTAGERVDSVTRCLECGAAVSADWTCPSCGTVLPTTDVRDKVSMAQTFEDVDDSTAVPVAGPSLWDQVSDAPTKQRRKRRLGSNFWVGLGLTVLISASAAFYLYANQLVEKNQQAARPPVVPAVSPAEHVVGEIAAAQEAQRLFIAVRPDASGTPFDVAPGKTVTVGTKAVTASEYSTIRVTVRNGVGYCIKISNDKADLTGGVVYYDSTTDQRTEGAPAANGACIR